VKVSIDTIAQRVVGVSLGDPRHSIVIKLVRRGSAGWRHLRDARGALERE